MSWTSDETIYGSALGKAVLELWDNLDPGMQTQLIKLGTKISRQGTTVSGQEYDFAQFVDRRKGPQNA